MSQLTQKCQLHKDSIERSQRNFLPTLLHAAATTVTTVVLRVLSEAGLLCFHRSLCAYAHPASILNSCKVKRLVFHAMLCLGSIEVFLLGKPESPQGSQCSSREVQRATECSFHSLLPLRLHGWRLAPCKLAEISEIFSASLPLNFRCPVLSTLSQTPRKGLQNPLSLELRDIQACLPKGMVSLWVGRKQEPT